MQHFRLLRADEIDARVAMVKKTGCSVLLYKDARVDQNILDETFGMFGWQRHHEIIGGNLYCTVAVKDPETGISIHRSLAGPDYSDCFYHNIHSISIHRSLAGPDPLPASPVHW